MKCPIDNVDLLMTTREGIEIDYCPTCRGVWLDRGELDKIIDRSGDDEPVQRSEVASQPLQSHDVIHTQKHYDHDDHYHRKHKKHSFISDLFDF